MFHLKATFKPSLPAPQDSPPLFSPTSSHLPDSESGQESPSMFPNTWPSSTLALTTIH